MINLLSLPAKPKVSASKVPTVIPRILASFLTSSNFSGSLRTCKTASLSFTSTPTFPKASVNVAPYSVIPLPRKAAITKPGEPPIAAPAAVIARAGAATPSVCPSKAPIASGLSKKGEKKAETVSTTPPVAFSESSKACLTVSRSVISSLSRLAREYCSYRSILA